MQSEEIVTNSKQYLHRLDDASSIERINALQQLQNLCRAAPDVVGNLALHRIFKFLYEQNITEECMETLDVIIRLIKIKNDDISRTNVELILSNVSNVELLLDLLEHEDLTVAVMANEVLNEIHKRNGETLERLIQECPDGMNKLLQRLSDDSREEVRNQALVFIKQLTSHNEEMKKTVVFNEGFEILFRIVRNEGAADDNGPVVQDCLEICKNLLSQSETCQRLFFGMGTEWILQVSEFFNPFALETSDPDVPWFQDHNKVKCAYFAIEILVSALDIVNPKHQNLLVLTVHTVTPMVCHWLIRQGPLCLVESSLRFLTNLVEGNANVTNHILNFNHTFTGFKKGKNVLNDFQGWRYSSMISADDDRKCINLPLILMESFVYLYKPWDVSVVVDKSNISKKEPFSLYYLELLEKLMITDASFPGMIVQLILAPVLHDGDEYGNLGGELSIGTVLINIVYDSCNQLLQSSSLASDTISNGKPNIINFEKACVILEIIFLHGGILARELSTALMISHCQSRSITNSSITNGQLLPYLLNCTGRAVRLPNSQIFVTSLLKVLSVISSECERATILMLEDPTNLFFLDLASPNSDTVGVASTVQVLSCLFCGCCMASLKVATKDSNDSKLTRQRFLAMIDSKIGLARFMDILKRPLSNGVNSQNLKQELFATESFGKFYTTQVDLILDVIYDYYTGTGTEISRLDGDSPEFKLIEMQKEKIASLEKVIASMSSSSSVSGTAMQMTDKSPNKIQASLASLESQNMQLQQRVYQLEKEQDEINVQMSEMQQILNQKDSETLELKSENALLSKQLYELEYEYTALKTRFEETQSTIGAAEKFVMSNGGASTESDEIVFLKSSVIRLENEKNNLKEILDQRDRKLNLIEEELRSPIPQEVNRDNRIKELESRNAELQQQLWSHEAEFNDLRNNIAESHQQLHYIKELVVGYTNQFGIPAELLQVVEDSDSVSYINSMLESCRNYVYTISGSSSDLAEGVGLHFVNSEEGSIARLVDCVEQMHQTVFTLKNEIETISSESVRKYEEYEREITFLSSHNNGSNTEETPLYTPFKDLDTRFTPRDLETEIQRLNNELAISNENVNVIQNDNSALNIKIEELMNHLKEYETSYYQLDAHKNQIESEILQYQEQVKLFEESSAQEKHALSCEVLSLQQQLDDSEKYRLHLEDSMAQLKLTMHEMESGDQNIASELSNKLIDSDRNRLELESNIAQLQQTVQQLQNCGQDVVSELQGKLLESENAVVQLQQTIGELQQGNQAADNELQGRLEIANQTVVQLENEITQFKEQQSESEQYRLELESNIAQLQQTVQQLQNGEQDVVSELQGKLFESENAVAQLQNTVGELQQSNQAADSELLGRLEIANQTVVQLENEITQFKEQLSESEQYRLELESNIAQLQQTVQQLQNGGQDVVSELQGKLFESENAVVQLQQTIGELQQGNQAADNELQSRLEIANQTVVQLENEITQFKEQLSESEQYRLELESNIAQLQQTVQQLQNGGQDVVSELQGKLFESENAVVQLQQTIGELQQRNQAADSELQSRLEIANQTVVQLENEITQFKEQLSESEQYRLELESNIAQLQQSVQQLQNGDQEVISELQGKLFESENAVAHLQNTIENLQQSNQAADSELLDRLAIADQNAVQLENEIVRIQSVCNEEVDALKQQLSELERHRLELLSNIEQIQQDMNANISVKDDRERQLIDELTSIKETLGDERSRHQDLTESQQSTITSLNNHVNELNTRMSELMTNMEEYQTSSKAKLEEFNRNIYEQAMALDEVNQRALDGENTVAQLNMSLNDLSTRNTELVSEKATLESTNAELSNQLNAALANITTLGENNTQLQAQINKLHSDLKDIRYYTTNVEQDLENHKKMLSHENALQTQQNELKRLQLKVDGLSQELHLKERELQQVLEQSRRHEGEAAGKSITLDSLSVEYELLQKDNENLSRKLAAETRANKELQREIEGLNISLKLRPNGNFDKAESVISSNHGFEDTINSSLHKFDSVASTPNKANSSKELAILQSNLIKEQHRLQQLQEEHFDLLGLLAQQEVELSIFRATVERELGDNAMQTTDTIVKQTVVDKYGSYTEYRGNFD